MFRSFLDTSIVDQVNKHRSSDAYEYTISWNSLMLNVVFVTKIVTNLAVLEIKDDKFYLLERAPGVSVEEIQKATEGTG